jgi:DMSO/TMAO reductase YedYZ molybdopterin-dependent catalytic subunit
MSPICSAPRPSLVELYPPATEPATVMTFGEYGYCANVQLTDLLRLTSLVAARLNGAPLTAEHGFPIRLELLE